VSFLPVLEPVAVYRVWCFYLQYVHNQHHPCTLFSYLLSPVQQPPSWFITSLVYCKHSCAQQLTCQSPGIALGAWTATPTADP
jgi:hypothetical protein